MIRIEVSINKNTKLDSRWIYVAKNDKYLTVKVNGDLCLHIDENELIRFQEILKIRKEKTVWD